MASKGVADGIMHESSTIGASEPDILGKGYRMRLTGKRSSSEKKVISEKPASEFNEISSAEFADFAAEKVERVREKVEKAIAT